jgi:hypothetical protein
MKQELIIGIDPGQNGAFAEIYPSGKVDCFPMFDEPDMRDYFESIKAFSECPVMIYLEQVGGYIGKPQPGSAMFVFGSGWGFIRGLISANKIPLTLVRPQTWQKGIPGLDGSKGPDRKRALKNHAARLFPTSKVTLSTADALLIADWGRRQTATLQ